MNYELKIKNCIYCHRDKLYELKNGYFKCPFCKRKFSPFKIEKERRLIEFFCKNINALQTSKTLGMSYITVQKKFMDFRYKLIIYLDKQFENKEKVNEYDEYIYLEKNKRKDKRYIFDVKDFLTFDYDEGMIYNMLLPELSRFKDSFLQDHLDETYYNEFSKYLKWHKIAKLKNKENLITRFWDFFEKSIAKHKGINQENFFFYLKEIEFKFNYDYDSRVKILTSI